MHASRVLAIALLGLGLALPAEAAGTKDNPKPSFDCATAKTKARQIVCSDIDLIRMDLQEDALLRRARAKAAVPDAINAEQDLWQFERDACASAACLAHAYRDRIGRLHAWTD